MLNIELENALLLDLQKHKGIKLIWSATANSLAKFNYRGEGLCIKIANDEVTILDRDIAGKTVYQEKLYDPAFNTKNVIKAVKEYANPNITAARNCVWVIPYRERQPNGKVYTFEGLSDPQ